MIIRCTIEKKKSICRFICHATDGSGSSIVRNAKIFNNPLEEEVESKDKELKLKASQPVPAPELDAKSLISQSKIAPLFIVKLVMVRFPIAAAAAEVPKVTC